MPEQRGASNGPPRPAFKAQRHNKKRKHDIDTKTRTSPSSKRKRAGSAEEDASLTTDTPNGSNPSEKESLLEEIRALGGDEEDLALVGDVASDSEHEGDGDIQEAVDAGLQAELQALAAQLGFQPLRAKNTGEKTSAQDASSKSMADAKKAASKDEATSKPTEPPAGAGTVQRATQTRSDEISSVPRSVSKQFVSYTEAPTTLRTEY